MSVVSGFCDFLNASPTPYHATKNLCQMFTAAGFGRLDEKQRWNLKAKGKYFFTRGDASFVAFVLGESAIEDTGIRVIGAHTDSPCLKVKPNADVVYKGFHQLGVAVYGGALLAPWFDRDLSIAGQVAYLTEAGGFAKALVNFERPIAVIPSLAIHLDRAANEGRAINPQKQMNAILQVGNDQASFKAILLEELQKQHSHAAKILDFNLSFYDTQPASQIGINANFFAGARLDNLLSCYLAASAMQQAGTEVTSVLICNDHEEIGSQTEIGAQGPLLSELIDRLVREPEGRQLTLRNSVMFSVDNAHGIHPNFSDKHDDKHGPVLNAGPVLKYDANQSYATSAETASLVRWLAQARDDQGVIPLQEYITRADMRCGSTIGPLTAAKTGIRAVDIGIPTFAMHSIRELAGVKDIDAMERLLARFVCVTEIPV